MDDLVKTNKGLLEKAFGWMMMPRGAYTMTMDLLGLRQEEWINGLEYAGVAAYLGDASNGKVNLFI